MRMTQDHGHHALGVLRADLAGPWRLGLLDATVSAVATRDGVRYWLRVAPVPQPPVWVRPNAIDESQALADQVPMPRVVDTAEWTESDPEDGQVTVRAYLFEHVDQQAISPTPTLATDPGVDEEWWADLRATHDTIRATSAAGRSRSPKHVARWVHKVAPALDTSGIVWESAHGDWHWANLLAPRLVVLDWEGFGLAPAGFDAACLLTYSLTHPPTADRVRVDFADELAGDSGLLAQVYAASWISSAIEEGFHPELREPLKRHIEALLS
ncbi:hypothetical protein GCM10007079_33070 [Nocardiopsis terrae]|uniref:Phosphotransferase enzyme family protein n=1 Tax=Nocardiopsis terrae TaxID=372655 RepID=A0ABR9HJD7_9ACTN|nr:phosphotransferase [Nocardiopsis terrae]MBE1459122.1 hypothetical protein [Nocardiopsis terrae]GHC88260.1 hypothetical protein GCM10007079_33070 [Nocardiopsis terrae]